MNFMEHVKSDRMCCFTYTEVHACFSRVREHASRDWAIASSMLYAILHKRVPFIQSTTIYIYTYINIYTYTYADFFPREHTRAIFLQSACKNRTRIGKRKRVGGKGKKEHISIGEPAARRVCACVYTCHHTPSRVRGRVRVTVFIEDCQWRRNAP